MINITCKYSTRAACSVTLLLIAFEPMHILYIDMILGLTSIKMVGVLLSSLIPLCINVSLIGKSLFC